MAAKTYRLSLKSNFVESEKVPDFVLDIQKDSQLDEEISSRLMLALSEAVTNAIVHGNKEDASKKVSVSVEVRPSEIISVVNDQGEGFDPDKTADPLDEENLLKPGGRGIFLIEQITDAVQFKNNGTTIEFTIHRQ